MENVINHQLLWENIVKYAKKVGRAAARPVLLLYKVLKSSDTKASDKMLIVAALSYLVLPIDLIPSSVIPILGWTDELLSIAIVYEKVKKYITPEMEVEVEWMLDKWFSEFPYEVMD